MRDELNKLAARVEALDGRNNGGDMTILTSEIALALGWVRVPPSQSSRRDGHWIAPEDCINGKPVYCSLHGTDLHRSPPPWLWSLDAAMSLVPEGWVIGSLEWWPMKSRSSVTLLEVADEGTWYGHDASRHAAARSGICPTPALALTAAALRARAEAQP